MNELFMTERGLLLGSLPVDPPSLLPDFTECQQGEDSKALGSGTFPETSAADANRISSDDSAALRQDPDLLESAPLSRSQR